jgi:hypothetical protein
MPKATGQVAVVNGRDGKFGKMWSLKLEGDETWYGTKSIRPDCTEGDVVEFSWAKNKRGYPDADLSTLVKLEGAAAEVPLAAASGGGGEVAAGRNAYDRKQAVIVYQSSRKDALELIKAAIAAEIVDFPAKGTKAEKYQALRMFVDMATNDFYYDAMAVFGGTEPGEEE